MTQTTEKERAEFEAWYIEGIRSDRPLFSSWSDSEIRNGCMYPDGDSYKVDSAKWMWQAWQAARRAPVVPWVRVIDEAMVLAHLGVADASDDYATAKDKLNRLICWEIDVAKYFSAEETRPPEETK